MPESKTSKTSRSQEARRSPPEATPHARDSLLKTLFELQSEFIRGGDPLRLLDRWLSLLLAEMGSEQGFLGAVRPGPEAGRPFQIVASTPPGWGEVESLQALAESTLSTGQPVPFAESLTAPGGTPRSPEPSAARSFLALPLHADATRVGLVGLVLRSELPSADILQPLLTVGGSLLQGWQATRRLQVELEELRQKLASVEMDVWDCDLSTQELHVSRRLREILGYAEHELEPTIETWRRLCHPEDLPRIEGILREHSEGHSPQAEFEYRARRKNGEWAWILSRARVALRDEQGRPVRLVGTDTDLTARKRDEERLSALLQAIPDLIFRIRGDGTYIDFSCSTAERTLLAPEMFVGKNMRELPIPQFLIDLTLSQLAYVLRESTVAVYEYDLEMPEGRQSYEARLVRSGPDEAVSIIRNITERRLIEERQAQLIQAEKLASLGQMAAGIAHEINNPVSYVTSNLKTLEQYATLLGPLLGSLRELVEAPGSEPRTLSAEQRQGLRRLWEQAEAEQLLTDMPELIQESLTGTRRIKEIAQSLRSFAREDDGKPQVVDLNAELESTLRMVGNELKYKCEVKRDFGPLPRITCHPTQLVQVFTNLLLNAGQALEQWGEIRIRTRQQGDEVVVEISDTGKGMTQETISKLFTPFFTTKPRGQGTGLGLSISRDIVTRHGGRLEVQSEPGRGSTFTLFLPVVPPT
ncbi:MAG: ATP-binding protein [Hyalangium sp.]|uniref:PAS domain-containing sensor histidine kinase n=1 Tax=Hyalangium sp. TaxID=2028555 RepID=UPI00389A7759